MTLPARTCGSAGAGPLIIIDLSGNQVLHGRTATSIGHELKTSSGDGLKQKTADVLSASHTGGSGGPLRVSEPGYIWELSRKFVEACRAAGIAPNADYNGTTQEGVGLYQTTTHKRRRWSAAASYLAPVRSRRNLSIETGAHATRLLVSEGRVTGVAYRASGQAHRAARSDSLRRCVKFPSSPDAVGFWPCRTPARTWCRRDP